MRRSFAGSTPIARPRAGPRSHRVVDPLETGSPMVLLIDSFGASRFRPLLPAIFLLLLSVGNAGAQPDNLARLQECARAAADSLLEGFAAGDTLCLSVADHPAAWIVEQAVTAVANARRNVIATCGPGDPRSLSVAITAIGVEYRETEDSDSLERNALLSVSALLPGGSRPGGISGRTSRTLSSARADTVATDDLGVQEGAGYPFAKGSSPASSGGFWSKVVEPAIVLGATAVVVILLFTVRSQ